MLHTKHNRAFGTALFLAAVWAIAAAIQPTSTYHLAPILVAGALPTLIGTQDKVVLASATAMGLALAVVVSLALAGLDWLRGPSLLPYGGALAEAITFSGIGAVGGAVATTLTAQLRPESAT
ncbi:MAG: hypothetical protein GY722_20355 [bacterium]|nr:hypothetical protein [bacterium]